MTSLLERQRSLNQSENSLCEIDFMLTLHILGPIPKYNEDRNRCFCMILYLHWVQRCVLQTHLNEATRTKAMQHRFHLGFLFSSRSNRASRRQMSTVAPDFQAGNARFELATGKHPGSQGIEYRWRVLKSLWSCSSQRQQQDWGERLAPRSVRPQSSYCSTHKQQWVWGARAAPHRNNNGTEKQLLSLSEAKRRLRSKSCSSQWKTDEQLLLAEPTVRLLWREELAANRCPPPSLRSTQR